MTVPCAVPSQGRPPGLLDSFYLGKPGAMTRLRQPDAVWAAPLSRSEVVHTLASGGTTTTRRRKARRSYSLAFSAMTPDDAEALVSYYVGSRGPGPYALIDPGWRNQLPQDDSTFGAAAGANTAWAIPAADPQPYLDPTFTPPVLGSGVLRWPTPVNGRTIVAGLNPGSLLPNVATAVPYVADQPYVVSVYLRTVTGTETVTLYALGTPASGWLGVLGTTTVCALTTTWQRFTTVVAAGLWTPAAAPYIIPAVQIVTAGSPDLLLANAQVGIGVTAPNPWVTGLGVPRVVIAGGLGSNQTRYWRRDHTLTLAEV